MIKKKCNSGYLWGMGLQVKDWSQAARYGCKACALCKPKWNHIPRPQWQWCPLELFNTAAALILDKINLLPTLLYYLSFYNTKAWRLRVNSRFEDCTIAVCLLARL